jgi:glycosidase
LFEKLDIFWHPKDRPQLSRIYHDLIRLRKDYPAFSSGRLEWLPNSADSKVVSFLRQDGKDEFLVTINFSNESVDGSLKVLNAAEFKPVNISGMSDSPAGNLPRFQLAGFGWRIYHRTVTEILTQKQTP